jgi:SAM-dependent methyltransferase
MIKKCNICGCLEFRDMGQRKDALCAKCGSYERTRVMKMFLERNPSLEGASIFHIAPERGLYSYLTQVASNYVTGDIDLERYSHIPSIHQIDLCNPDTFMHLGEFDFIIHSHVLEHVPCNYSAVLINLHRLLKRGGTHMFAFPIYGSAYEEDLSDLTEAERERRFGQFDHCRRFSPADLKQTLGAVFDFPEKYDLREHFPDSVLDEANIPEIARTGYSGHSVFRISKSDLRV